MANWSKVKSRGNVEDRRMNPLPPAITRPMVAKAVPTLGLPKRTNTLAAQGVAKVGNKRVGTLGRLPKRTR